MKVFLLLLGVFCFCSCQLLNKFGANRINGPEGALEDPELTEIIDNAFHDSFKDKITRDYHVHFFGKELPEEFLFLDRANTHSLFNINKFIPNPIYRCFVKPVFLDAIAVNDINQMDKQFLDRLAGLISFFGPPKNYNSPNNEHFKNVFYLMNMDGIYKPFKDSDGNYILDDKGNITYGLDLDKNNYFYIQPIYN